MSTCQATCADGYRCTLHQGHRGTHYDSLEDVSFEEDFPPRRVCELCGKASSTGCGHVSDGLPSDDHCPACGRCWRDECQDEQEPDCGACEHSKREPGSACARCVATLQRGEAA